ncbi:MAG TPA: hypothetical protein VFG68_07430 [Fimbriiglobus sp.]|nr:hypothetical protein [Fimbriiglobus sp.]
MADRWALVIAIDNFLDPEWGLVPFAESGARALADALAAAGYPAERQFVLLGSQATKTVIESRLRKLKKVVRRGDDVLAYVAGCGFSRAGTGSLTCWDTLPDDPAETALPVADLVSGLTATRAGQVVVLLDVGLGAPLPDAAPADMRPALDADELASLFGDSSKAVGLTSARPEEPAYAAARLKAGVWTALLIDTLTGRAAKALDPDGHVTAASLQRFVEGEMPRLLRKHFDSGDVQTPQLYGEHNAGAVIADLSHLTGGDGLLDPGRLRRVAFRSESLGRVKDLTNWRKTFDLPDNARPSAKKFVARVATADVKADLDEVYEAARDRLGYKRKDLDAATGPDGFGVLRTPDFEYTVTAALDVEDPTRVAWRREVGGFADPGFVRGPGFDAVFGKLFDQLVFEFAVPVDVEALVDRLEDRPPKGVKVRVASDGHSCDVTLAGFAGRVTVDRHTLTVRGRAGDSAGLLDQFLAFLRTVGPLGERAALPPAR